MPKLPLKPRAFSPLLPSHQSPIFPQHQPPLSSSLQSRLVFMSVLPVYATHLEIYAILNCVPFCSLFPCLFYRMFYLPEYRSYQSLETPFVPSLVKPLKQALDVGCWFVMLMSKIPTLERPFCVSSGNKGQEDFQALWMCILTTSRTGGGVSGRPGKRLRLY